MTNRPTDTAHEAWDESWRSQAGRAEWLEPEAEVVDFAARLRLEGARTALDLGCGVGRHALALARLGFETAAVDASEAGLAELARAAQTIGVTVDARRSRMTRLPFADASFDYVLAWNVIYHGDRDVVAATVAEIARVLKPGGHYQGTMLTLRNRHCGVGTEVAPGTWVDPTADDDKVHPHFYCDAAGLARLFTGFEILTLAQDEMGRPGHWHWRLTLQKH